MNDFSRCRDCRRPMVAQKVYRRDPAAWRGRGYTRRGAGDLCEACNRLQQRGGTPAPPPTGEDQQWREQARCRDTDPELWFPDKGQPGREVRLICAGCEVRAQCLAYALKRQEKYGIWGGTSEHERRHLLAARKTTAATELREAS